jgi:hypothetical protein
VGKIRRIGIGLKEHQLERLRSLCEETGASQNRLFVAMVSICSVAEMKDILARYEQLELIEGNLHQAADLNLRGYVRGKSLSDLKVMLESMKQVRT